MADPKPPNERNQFFIPEEEVAADFRIADLYMGFSAELLRLALIGIGALGFLLSEKVLDRSALLTGHSRGTIIAAVMLLLLSACLSLAHRYLASESMAYQLSVLRTRRVLAGKEEGEERNAKAGELKAEIDRWHARLKWSGHFLAGASIALGLGIASLSIGLVLALSA